MTLSGLETTLLVGSSSFTVGVVGLVLGFVKGGKNKVPRAECDLKHEAQDKFITAEFRHFREDLKEIKAELKKMNGHRESRL